MIETRATILCALCGIKFIPSMGSICQTCTIKSLEEQKFLQGQQINYCRYCERYERPPWINCERQSQQMLTILLKKIRGIAKVQVKSASFVWTQPHSKRMKLKIVFNKEVSQGIKIQVTEIVQFIQKYTQCNDCRKKFTDHDWIALIQLRQQARHKKTILSLEQVLLKQKLLDKIIKTEQVQGGIDIFFGSETDASRLIDFLKSRYPLTIKTSSKLISHNQRQNTSNVKTTYSCLLPKICKDDLVHIPRKLSKELGSCCQVLLCTKVSSILHFLDVSTFKKIQINSTQYSLYQNQIQIYPLKIYGKKFSVLDCETRQTETSQKYASFGITFMKQDQYVQLYTKCHFSQQTGNELIGYELSQIENISQINKIPDFLMVQKVKDKEIKRKIKSQKRKKEAQIRKKQSKAHSQVSRQNQSSSDEDIWEDVQQQTAQILQKHAENVQLQPVNKPSQTQQNKNKNKKQIQKQQQHEQ